MISANLKLIITGLLMLTSTCGWCLDLRTVLEASSVKPPSRVGFREQRHNPLLKVPIVLTGYLEYPRTGHLRKVVETPFEEAFLITEDHIEIERDGKTRRLSLSQSKPLREILGAMEAILAGQADRLVSLFQYELSGTRAAWLLRLEPRSRKISAHLAAMLIEGDCDSVNSIRLELKDGEWSLMEILDIDPKP